MCVCVFVHDYHSVQGKAPLPDKHASNESAHQAVSMDAFQATGVVNVHRPYNF